MARRKKLHRSPGITLHAHGVTVSASPRHPRGGLRLFLESERKGAYFNVVVSLGESEADDFFAELARACGYATPRPRRRRSAHCWSAEGDTVVAVGLAEAADGKAAGKHTSYCHVMLSPHQASRLLHHLARPLGWDLA